MNQEEGVEQSPASVRSGTVDPYIVLKRSEGHYAVHGPMAEGESDTPDAVLNGGAIRLHHGEPSEELVASATIGPAYHDDHYGTSAVPTGRCFVRFTEDVPAETRQADIENAGYTLDEVVPYASYAAWVSPRSGQIPDGLHNIEKLEAIADVVNVEPQMLSEAVPRPDGIAKQK